MKQLNWYLLFGSKVPDGKTVTPTDDIQIWLHCADIWDKSYTTLGEVLNDTATLATLMASNNAVDYLVRSTTWAVLITVPIMTSNTTPEGVASCDKNFANDPAWHAFDQNVATQWSTFGQTNPATGKVRYQFTNPVAITTVTALIPYDSGYRAKDYKVNASNDGVTYQTLASGTFTPKSETSTETITFQNTDKYLYWELEIDSTYSGAVNIKVLQFYSDSIITSAAAMQLIGANDYAANTLLADSTWREAICNSTYFESVLNVKVPVMTSNTTPSGVASASSINSRLAKQAYMAFDGTAGQNYWGSEENSTDSYQYVAYKFEQLLKVYLVEYWGLGFKPNSEVLIQASADDFTTTTDIGSYTVSSAGQDDNTHGTLIVADPISADSYRAYGRKPSGSGGTYAVVRELQFYGRADV